MLGKVLQAERERRQLTIHDIEEGTSIRALYIEAIENGNYDKLPGDVYTKGFIRNYATFLNLDGEELVKQFTAERTPEVVVVEGAATETAKKSEPAKEKVEEPAEPIKVSRRDRMSSRSDSSGSSFKLIAAVILIAAIAGGAWYYLTNFGAGIADENNNPPKIEQPQVADNNPPQNQNQTPIVEEQKPNTVAAATNQSGVNIQAKFNGDCWTQVIVDGALVYEDVAVSGQVLNWSGKDNVVIRVGNAGVVDFTENGRNIGRPGDIGEVVERTFTKT